MSLLGQRGPVHAPPEGLEARQPGIRGHIGTVVVAFACGTAFGAMYEVYEYVAVHAFGADLHIGYADSIDDLVDDALASLAGGGLLVVWSAYGWSTLRRAARSPHQRRRLGRCVA